MAQGAAMAIEDAAVLATVLAQGKGLEEKLEDYYRFRLTRTKAIQRGSQANARLFHLGGPAAWIRDQVARRTTGKNPLHWVFQHDVYQSTASAIQRG
jgi:salicylate hydroxylase